MTTARSRITTVLFDADGVLQHHEHTWYEALSALGGPDFAAYLLENERPSLTGRITLHDLVTDSLRSTGSDGDLREILHLWEITEVDQGTHALIRELRALGIVTGLATNQQRERATRMRTLLGYDGLCDADFYSCEIGVAKPDPAYFRHIVRILNRDPGECLFIDDRADNTAAAESVGLATVTHDPATRAETLRREVAAFVPSLAERLAEHA